MSFSVFLALRHVRRRPLQSGLTVLGVAVGVMVLIVALSLTNGFIDELLRSTLQATPHVTLFGFDGDTLEHDPSLAAHIAEHPEVQAAAPYLANRALIARRADRQRGISGRQDYTQILGILPELHQQVLELAVLERYQDQLDDQGIILGLSLARNLGVFVGDEVFIRDIQGNSRTFTVVATFQVGNELIDSVTSFTALEPLQSFARSPGQISGYHLRLRDPEQAGAVAEELSLQLGLLGSAWQQLFGTLIEQLQLQKALISVVTFLIVLVAAMGIANILIVTVAEKTEEIAILRALGASRQQIIRVFSLEGLLLGGSGTLLGVLLGLAVSWYFKVQPFPLPGDLYFITRLPVELQMFDFVWVAGMSLLTTWIAGVIPARRASGLEPAQILR